MFTANEFSDIADYAICNLLEYQVKVVHVPASIQCHQGNLIFWQTSHYLPIPLKLFKWIPQDIIFIATGAFRLILSHYFKA